MMMAKQRKSIGASDLMAELQNDPEWVEQDRQREEKRAAAELRFREEEQPIIADLGRIGYDVGSVYDLVNTSASYPDAVPVLLEHLPRPYHPRIRQGISRALTVREARGLAGSVVLDELQREGDAETRWTLANALTVMATRQDADRIAALASDPAYEDVHERLDQALKTAGKP